MCRPDGRHVFLKGKVQMITYLQKKNRHQKNLTNFQLSFLKISKVSLYITKIFYFLNKYQMLPNHCQFLNKFV